MQITTMSTGGKPGKTVQYLIDQEEKESLLFNSEYQRAPAWNRRQKQLFVDSVFRGYPIPAFYFHKQAGGEGVVDVIDGQQRIRAICGFVGGEFRCLHASEFKMPSPQDSNSPWLGKKFAALPDDLKRDFCGRPIVIHEMAAVSDIVVRDLFIRLQGGKPLSPQEILDAYPGEFSEYIKQIGGKPTLNREEAFLYSGHRFFNEFVRGKEKSVPKRKLAAQLSMLLWENRPGGELVFCDINSQTIANFYWARVNDGFDPDNSEGAVRLEKVMDGICDIFPDNPKLHGHQAIHLSLLVNSLMDGYPQGWGQHLPEAFRNFCEKFQKAKNSGKGEYFSRYAQWTRQQTDREHAIRTRHEFFLQEMLPQISAKLENTLREFSIAEKQYIYLRDRGMCQWCRWTRTKDSGAWNPIAWGDDMKIHVFRPEMGVAELDNGALVHSRCHENLLRQHPPAEFQIWFRSKARGASVGKRKIHMLPDKTECRFVYHEEESSYVYGQITGGRLHIPADESDPKAPKFGSFGSFKEASEAILNHNPGSHNWWKEWEIRLPDNDEWMSADDWRPE